MSDYDYCNPETRSSATPHTTLMCGAQPSLGWVAAAVFVAIVLAVVFGMGRQPGQTGTNTVSNETRPPMTTQSAPPANDLRRQCQRRQTPLRRNNPAPGRQRTIKASK